MPSVHSVPGPPGTSCVFWEIGKVHSVNKRKAHPREMGEMEAIGLMSIPRQVWGDGSRAGSRGWIRGGVGMANDLSRCSSSLPVSRSPRWGHHWVSVSWPGDHGGKGGLPVLGSPHSAAGSGRPSSPRQPTSG